MACSAAKNLGALTTDFLVYAEKGGSKVQGYVYGLVDKASDNNDKVKQCVETVSKYQNQIMKSIFFLGCALNFYYSSLLFSVGTVAGFIGSTSLSPVPFESLQRGEVLGHTKEYGFAAQKVMGGLAFLNIYLGDTWIDNMFFGLFGGLLAGNNLYYMFQDTTVVKKTLEGVEKLAEVAKSTFNQNR